MEEEDKDKREFDSAIHYCKTLFQSNISTCASHKMGATFIGIKTNISGTLKLHVYILFFPFIRNESVVPYSIGFPNLYLKDVCLNVDESFYVWMYEKMKNQNSIVIMSLEANILKVVSNTGDLLINRIIDCNELKEWMTLEYDAWMEKHLFNNVFTLKIINPYLYMVPFPVRPIVIQTINSNNYIKIVNNMDEHM